MQKWNILSNSKKMNSAVAGDLCSVVELPEKYMILRNTKYHNWRHGVGYVWSIIQIEFRNCCCCRHHLSIVSVNRYDSNALSMHPIKGRQLDSVWSSSSPSVFIPNRWQSMKTSTSTADVRQSTPVTMTKAVMRYSPMCDYIEVFRVQKFVAVLVLFIDCVSGLRRIQ